MKKRTIIAIVAGAVAVAVLILFVLIVFWLSCARRSPRSGAGASGGAAATAPITQGAPSEIKTQQVTIYQRSDQDDPILAGVPAQVVWFTAPVDRARQVVQLVLEGVPGAENATPPGPPGIQYRDVYITKTGVAWVDLDGATLGGLDGSDEELALVGALARSLTEALGEVQRVGVLVDGRPRQTLAGHVDLTRTYTGREWPAIGGSAASPPPPPETPAPPTAASPSASPAPAAASPSASPSASPAPPPSTASPPAPPSNPGQQP